MASVDNAEHLVRQAAEIPPSNDQENRPTRRDGNRVERDDILTELLGHKSNRMDTFQCSLADDREVLESTLEGLITRP